MVGVEGTMDWKSEARGGGGKRKRKSMGGMGCKMIDSGV